MFWEKHVDPQHRGICLLAVFIPGVVNLAFFLADFFFLSLGNL
jgi:hypothetical protein